MNNDSAPERFAASELIVPSFERLVSSLYSAVMYNLGELKLRGVPDAPVDLTLARFNLGLLHLLEEKCRGNLTEKEAGFLSSVIENAEQAIAAHTGNGNDASDAARG